MTFNIDLRRGVGYVVCAYDEEIFKDYPNGLRALRNFGQNEGAAKEFRDWLERYADLGMVRGYAISYHAEEVYTYPVFNAVRDRRPRLIRERR